MGKTKQQKVKDFLINNGVIIVMFILVIYTGLTSNNFFTGNNLMNILMNMSSRLVIALGIAGCVITAGYETIERSFSSDHRNAHLCSIWYSNRYLYCILKCTAFHCNLSNDGNRLWYWTYRYKRNTSWWIC